MQRFVLAVIGSGSGNVVISDDIGEAEVALIESGSFGGTCVNRGCIPSKMFAYTADLAMLVRVRRTSACRQHSPGSIGRPSETGSSIE